MTAEELRAADTEASLPRLATDERSAMLVLTETISRDHTQISGHLERMAEALDRLEEQARTGFWRGLGNVVVTGAGRACESVGGHRAMIVLGVLVILIWPDGLAAIVVSRLLGVADQPTTIEAPVTVVPP